MASMRDIENGDPVSNAARAETIRDLPLRRPLRSATRRFHGPPLVVTDRALSKLDSILNQQRRRSSQALGLVLESGGAIGLVLDEPGSGDVLFLHDAQPVLFITAEVAARLAGHVLDVDGATGSGRFSLLPAPD
jgi:hypothetical protein